MLKFEKTNLKNFEDVSSLFSKNIPEKNGLKKHLIIFSENPYSLMNSNVVFSFVLSLSIEYPVSEYFNFNILSLSFNVDKPENNV